MRRRARPQNFATLARLAATEVGIHRLDCEDSLGLPRSMTAGQALDGLAFTTDTWWPALARGEPPEGSVALVVDDHRFVAGRGAEVARIGGSAVAVLAAAWGRRAEVEVRGDGASAAWWTSLTARTTA